MSDRSMACREARAELPLDDGSPASVHAHVATCADCRAIATELSGMLAARRELADAELSPFDEARVLARLRPLMQPRERRWSVWWLAALSTMAAAIAIVVMVRHPERGSPVRLAASVGRVTTSAPALDVGSSFTTAEHGRALVELPRSRVAALADTAVQVEAAGPDDVRLRVEHGAVVADVDPGETKARRFVIATPHTEVVVTGTRFFVVAHGDHEQVAVSRGHVTVRSRGQTTLLSAGELADVDGAGVVVRRLDVAESGRISRALSAREWLGDEVESLSAGLTARDAVVPPPVVVPLPPVVLRAPAPHKGLEKGRGPVAEARPAESVPPELAAVSAALELRDCDRASALAAPLTVRGDAASRVWFALAQCYHAAERRAEAAAAYGEVVRRFPTAAVSENAAYEVARLSRELGRNRVAESAFMDYLAKYPRGALAEEATFWRCHLAAANAHADDAIACLRGFRSGFAASPRATETYLLEGTLERTAKNDCAAAIVAYRSYLDSGGTNREQAERWLAWCEGRR